MEKVADRPRGTESELGDSRPKADEVRRELHSILESRVFHGSKRCQQFLEYVVEKSLSGEPGALKERTIAMEVFGRQHPANLNDDTIVRVGAREVRKRLAQYYVTPEGAASTLRIDLPPGSYAPVFRHPVELHEVEEHPPAARPRRPILLLMGAVIVAVVAFVAYARLTAPDPNAVAFARFWDPAFHASEPLLLAVGNPIVYHPSSRARMMSESRLPPQPIPLQRPIQLPPDELDGSDMVPVFNQYVGFGDLVTATEISAMMAKHAKPLRVRLASSVAFADMRQTQTLLIGAFTNRWTMELGQNWRFQFTRPKNGAAEIMDTTNGRQWSVSSKDDGSAPEDYILIGRIRNSSAGGFLVLAAGVKQFGTEAAGRVLTDPAQLGAILNRLPVGWESKNLQVVLHAKVIGNAPAQPEVVASHVW